MKQKRVLKWTGMIFVSLFVLAACANSGKTVSGNGASALPDDFEITAYQAEDVLGGQAVNLSQVLAQGKPVVLDFWAGLCPGCRLDLLDLQAVYETHHEIIDHWARLVVRVWHHRRFSLDQGVKRAPPRRDFSSGAAHVDAAIC